MHFLTPLYEHIRRKEAIELHYHSFRSAKESIFRLSPYILCEYNNRWFLLGYNKRRGVMTLALDRMLSVQKDEGGTYIENTFFEPNKYFAEMIGEPLPKGGFHFIILPILKNTYLCSVGL